MKGQFQAILGMVTHPKVTIMSLPSYRFFVMSFVIASYFGMARSLRKGHFYQFSNVFHSKIVAIIIMFLIMFVGFFLGAQIIKGIVSLFGKRLTVTKVMHIVGYSQTPRLLISVPFSLTYPFLPQDIRTSIEMGEKGIPIIIFSILGVIGLILFIYSTYLLIWGLVKCPDYKKEI